LPPWRPDARKFRLTGGRKGLRKLRLTVGLTGARKLRDVVGLTGARKLRYVTGLTGARKLRYVVGLTGARKLRYVAGLTGARKLRFAVGLTGARKLELASAGSFLAGSNVLTSLGVGSSDRINFPVSRPRSGIALADASDNALATTTIVKRNVFIKPANTVFSPGPHGKRVGFGQYSREFSGIADSSGF
jgi:hypothetical protein